MTEQAFWESVFGRATQPASDRSEQDQENQAMTAPRHTQLMDPADDPEEFIAASIYWYPLIFPTRTEVLDHTLLCSGNGYEWGEDGNIRSVFSHIEPDYDRLDKYEVRAREYEAESPHLQFMADFQREEHARLLVIRDGYRNLARTYGPIKTTVEYGPGDERNHPRMIGTRDLAWTLLGRVPANVTPAWQRVIDETRKLFAPLFTEQTPLF